MQKIQDLIPETLAQVLTLPRRAATLSPALLLEGPLVKNPLKTKWQQKWIRLDVVHPLLQIAGDEAENFCARWFNNSPKNSLLVIVGTYGSGKSHTAAAIFRFCLNAAMRSYELRKWPGSQFPTCHYLRWPEVVSQFEQKNTSAMTDALETSLLVLDDIGADHDPWKVAADKLCQILSRRERMFTVATTNIQPGEWAERFDGRIADRLLRNSVVVDLTGVPSFAMRKP